MSVILLLILVWPVSPAPILFCQNTERQIENILSLLQTITSLTQTKLREGKSSLNIDQCTLAQRLTNYQECDDLPEIKEISFMKVETKGLVDNLQSSKSGCVLSPAMCPYSDMPLWPKINTVLENWSYDVAACKNELQRMCSSLNYNSV